MGIFDPEFFEDSEPQSADPDPFFDTPDPDPFFEGPTPHEPGLAYYDAWRIEDMVRSGELQRDGWRPGDMVPLTWESIDGKMFSTDVRLPEDWRRHDAWSAFYERLREFFYPLWEEDTGHEYDHEGGYLGEATAG